MLVTVPRPNTTFNGHIHVGSTSDFFQYVFNEQILNPDRSLTVNAAHQYLLGPTAVGDLIIGQSVAGVTVVPESTGLIGLAALAALRLRRRSR